MRENRSMPQAVVIPELAYADVGGAIAWLRDAFGFTLRLRIGNHRAQMNVGAGAVVLTARANAAAGEDRAHSVMVRVDDVDAHHERARHHGAQVVRPPTDYPYGERQYTAVDPGGHVWTFSQSVSDVDPRDWGGEPG